MVVGKRKRGGERKDVFIYKHRECHEKRG